MTPAGGSVPGSQPKPLLRRLRKALRRTPVGRLIQRVEYGLFRLAFWLLARVPAGLREPVAGVLAFAVRLLHRRAWRTARANLARAYAGREADLAREHFRHLAGAAMDVARLDRELANGNPADVFPRWVEADGLAALEQAARDGRGAILVVPHFGNWEVLGLELARRGFPLTTIARTFDNPWVHRWMVRFRSRTGLRLLDKQGAVRGAVRTLRDGRVLLVLPDQYGGSTGVPVRFFGARTSAPGLVGALARRLGAPVLLGTCLRTGSGRYRLRCRAIELPPEGGAEAATQAVFDAVEEAVRKAPEQWLWVHGFWRGESAKTRERTLYRRLKRKLKGVGLWRHVQVLQYLAFRALVAAGAAIPVAAFPHVARGLAAVLPLLCRRERRAFDRNLDLVFGPAFPPVARARAMRAVFASFANMAYDCLLFPRRVRQATWRRRFQIDGTSHVDSARQAGRGAVFVAAHMGNWELASLHLAAIGYPMVVIFAERTNPLIDRFLTSLRISTGTEFLPREGAIKKAVRALQANKCLSVAVDIDAGPAGLFVDFFGIPASTMPTAAWLARKTGAALIPFSSVRTGLLSYRNTFHPPIPVLPTDQETMQQVTAVLESAIRATPEQWAWFNHRWKTRP